MMHRLDDEKISEMCWRWIEDYRKDWLERDNPLTKIRCGWAPLYIYDYGNGEFHFVNNEGVGGHVNGTTQKDAPIELFESGEGWIGAASTVTHRLTYDELPEFLSGEMVPLEACVRVFGDRLESNLYGHVAAIRAKIIEFGLEEEE